MKIGQNGYPKVKVLRSNVSYLNTIKQSMNFLLTFNHHLPSFPSDIRNCPNLRNACLHPSHLLLRRNRVKEKRQAVRTNPILQALIPEAPLLNLKRKRRKRRSRSLCQLGQGLFQVVLNMIHIGKIYKEISTTICLIMAS